MSHRLLGIGASPGRASGPAKWIHWDLPPPEHRTISPDEVEAEVRRFHEARVWAQERIRTIRDRTAEEVGAIEAKIFEPQMLMLDDPDLVQGTVSYIRDNFLSAERAFDWRVLEIRSRWLDTAHAMVLDRLADLQDIRFRVLSRLLGRDDGSVEPPATPSILLLDDLTPSLAVRLDPSRVLGAVTAAGSRSSHSAVLARSIGIPAVVGVGPGLRDIEEGTELIVDGSTGRIIVAPTPEEREAHRLTVERLTSWHERLDELAAEPPVTADGRRVRLRANLDQPDDARAAARSGAEGVGLFRSEFLVIGRRVIPSEDEQYQAYRSVAEAFADHPVTLRTFDIGGDKFPIFLEMPSEENPYLGWRAIRVCLDLPDLFRNQLRAVVRASAHGHMRILLPFIVSVEEVRRTREILREVMEEHGMAPGDIPLGIMVETPAALETLDVLATHVDFLSLGTNDLTQYVMAADRGNARLSYLHDPLHPALFRMYRRLLAGAAAHELPVGVCGDLATDPVGLAVLLGLGYRDFSLPPSSIPEVREVVRAVSAEELEEICAGLDGCETAGEIRAPVALYLEGAVPFQAAALRLSTG